MEKEYFKLKWMESGHYSSMSELNSSNAKFIDYVRDEAGNPIGVEVEYDGGHGYGFDDSHKREKLYPHKKVSLSYWYTSTTEGGSDWDDGSIHNFVELIPIEELTDGEKQGEQ
ncbi:MAG: hypothetical protein LUC47_04750 [Clostridiales bacterium]|nr:hypothetical protein [Clostridiales bacterium]